VRVPGASRARSVPWNRSREDVLRIGPPPERCKRRAASCRLPWLICRTPSLSRLLTLCLITVPRGNPDQLSTGARPRPAVRLPFSRKARLRRPGEAAHPAVQLRLSQALRPQARTCRRSRSAHFASRHRLTPPPDPASRLHAHGSGWHVDQIYPSLFDEGLMHPLTVRARTVTTMTIDSVGFRRPSTIVPRLALQLCWHGLHR